MGFGDPPGRRGPGSKNLLSRPADAAKMERKDPTPTSIGESPAGAAERPPAGSAGGKTMRKKLESYQGLTALVTGASSGIGRALALRLAGRGARLALLARREAELAVVAAAVRQAGGEALVLPCDLGDRGRIEAACARALESLGSVDLLVNNAGYGGHRLFLEWDADDMERVMRVNYLGSLHVTRCLLPAMAERRRGWIVFVSSVAGRIGTPGESAYAASKFALTGLAEALSVEVEDAGVHVLTVFPGVIDTPFFDAAARARMPRVALDRMVGVDGLVDAILRSLARGCRELTYPRSLAVAYLVRALAPGFFRRQVKRVTLGSRSTERRRT
jgi:short-subunit dehydrogenase